MPRIARKYKYASFFHSIVQGIDKEDIFKKDRYINRYMSILKEKTNEIGIDIIAYCIMPNHAHFILKADGVSKLSKLMQKVNTSYARYYNYMENGRAGYVFRDRFLSEPIDSKRYLINCIKYIHNNPVKACIVNRCEEYKYSSYGDYTEILKSYDGNKAYISKTIKKENIEDILEKEELVDICRCNKISMKELNNMKVTDVEKESIDTGILRFIQKEQINTYEIFEKRDTLINLFKYLKNVEKIKYIHIARKFEMNKGTLEGILENIRKKKQIGK